ncbi:MAG: F0F1 ATP synthase subunit B [Elusimicrobia bacterium]|nr:F0F1 ATP synthase subunit B [Elusimicrobiota bacterium]
MDKLFAVEPGLMAWTVVTFLLLVAILAKYAWRPLIEALDARDARVKADADSAQEARNAAEKIKAEMEKQLSGIDAKGKEMVAEAVREGEAVAARIRAEAQAQAQAAKERALADLEGEKRRLIRELRSEVASLSVMAAERLLRRSVDPGVEKTVMESFLKDMEKKQYPRGGAC